MILVHDIFVCKPGNASKMAKICRETMSKGPSFVNVLTDMTGQFHRVIMVSKYENLAEYQKAMDAYINPTPEMKEEMDKMKGFNDMYISGSREIYRVW